jgi:hypothetical protein
MGVSEYDYDIDFFSLFFIWKYIKIIYFLFLKNYF